MTIINLDLTEEEARGLIAILDSRIKTVQEWHDQSHSGVDRLLYQTDIINTTALRDRVRARVPVPMPAPMYEGVIPEA